MRSLMTKNLKVAAPRVLACLGFYILFCIVTGGSEPWLVVFMMNLACIMTAQDSREMMVESSWPVDRRNSVDVRYILMLLTMVLFCAVIAFSDGNALGTMGVGCFIVSLSSGTAFIFAVRGKNFMSALISGASSAVIMIIMMDGEVCGIIPWYAFMFLAVAVFMISRIIAMRSWMKGGAQR